jgi:hypothetical protein
MILYNRLRLDRNRTDSKRDRWWHDDTFGGVDRSGDGRGLADLRRDGCTAGRRATDGNNRLMPEISRFFGIIIRMFYNDHEPAHFHTLYGEDEALVEVETLAVLRGALPRRALALVLEWAAIHQPELRQDWQRARSGEVLAPIAPLD